jgi:hypothetical protein
MSEFHEMSSKFREIIEKLWKMPAHSRHDTKGLTVAITYIGNLMKEATEASEANELTKEESTEIFSLLGRDIQRLKDKVKSINSINQAVEDRKKLIEKSREMLTALGIFYSVRGGEDTVKITNLYEIFSDENRFNEIVRKLKIRAFW